MEAAVAARLGQVLGEAELQLYRAAGRPPSNPNVLSKTQRPWFTPACRIAKRRVR